MRLEQVLSHPTKEDVYLNRILIPHGKVRHVDITIVNRILLRELSIDTFPVFN